MVNRIGNIRRTGKIEIYIVVIITFLLFQISASGFLWDFEPEVSTASQVERRTHTRSEMNYTLMTWYFEDSFENELKIEYKENVIIDIEMENVRLENTSDNGLLTSKNLLDLLHVIAEPIELHTLNFFNNTVFVSNGTSITIQFSQDSISWYDSQGEINAWESLENGFNSIDLANLGWIKPDFYYRVNFSSDNKNIPTLKHINLSYIVKLTMNPDTDNDGYLDEWEEFLETDPNDFYDIPMDTDLDGRPDGDHNNSQDWMDIDDDDDVIPDYWELSQSLDPKNASDAVDDPDQDGFSNLDEYLKGTDPFDTNDYPKRPNGPTQIRDEDWGSFLFFLIFIVIVMMIISAIIARIVIEKRKREDEFWTETFGDSDHDGDSASKSKEEYHSWVRKIEDGKPKKQLHKQKIKLEVIGGPPDAPGHLDEMYKDPTQSRKKHSNSTSKKKRGIHGKSCLWCDRGITAKYVKRCPDRRTKTERCSDGPFCSEKCLNEHLDTVPHYQEANF